MSKRKDILVCFYSNIFWIKPLRSKYEGLDLKGYVGSHPFQTFLLLFLHWLLWKILEPNKFLEVSYLIKMTVDSSYKQKNTAYSFLIFLKFTGYSSFSRSFHAKNCSGLDSIKLDSRKCVRHILKRSLLQNEIHFLKVQCNIFTAFYFPIGFQLIPVFNYIFICTEFITAFPSQLSSTWKFYSV